MAKNILKLQVFSDPGHAWLRVPKSTMARLRISLGERPFSYHSRCFVYLEEDCDAGAFLEMVKFVYPDIVIEQKTRWTNRESAIRKLPRMTAGDGYRDAGNIYA